MQRYAQLHREGRLNALQRAFFEPRAAEELFDCAADPHNVTNLAGDPAHRDLLERLRASHRAHLIRVRDSGFLPEAMMIAESGGRSPTAITRDPTRYPIERLLDLADACQLEGRTAAALAALQDPQPVMRYWAVAGMLTCQDPAVQSAIADRLDDPDAAVRVVAAEAVLRAGPNPKAWAVLQAAIMPDQSPAHQLAALNALVYLPAGPQPLRRQIHAIAAQEDSGGNEAMKIEYTPRAAKDLIERGLA